MNAVLPCSPLMGPRPGQLLLPPPVVAPGLSVGTLSPLSQEVRSQLVSRDSKVGLFIGHPLDKAKAAFDRSQLIHHAWTIHNDRPGAAVLEEHENQAVRDLESSFKLFYDERKGPVTGEINREYLIEKIARRCPQKYWDVQPEFRLTAISLLNECTDDELKMLYSAVILVNFLKKEKIQVVKEARMGRFFTGPQGSRVCDSRTVSVVALHLLKIVGAAGFKVAVLGSVPSPAAHLNLALGLASGQSIFLNNADVFLPPDYWDRTQRSSGLIHDGALLPEWTAVGALYHGLGNYYQKRGNAKKAEAFFEAALLIDSRFRQPGEFDIPLPDA
ncbi:MAG: tetratricopeptide repeat protein [Deltaproteobacteria bacterium]|nr:tetratricopeptide repeat protein [Deltaproteobacteria bacterium]